jgi:hypothetical protein
MQQTLPFLVKPPVKSPHFQRGFTFLQVFGAAFVIGFGMETLMIKSGYYQALIDAESKRRNLKLEATLSSGEIIHVVEILGNETEK